MTLYDPDIRRSLIKKLESQSNKPKAIIEELRVHNGNAIADIVSLHLEAHCYEIKGCADKIERIKSQGVFYNASFRKITLVTTEKHIKKAIDISPPYWGIMIAVERNGEVVIRNIRKAKNNPEFNKELASLTLWKSEMLSLLNEKKLNKKPRAFLAQLLSESKKKVQLSNDICETLIGRHVGN